VNAGVLRFSFLESGRGETILIDFPGGHKAIVDCCTSITGCRLDIETEIAATGGHIAFVCLTHPHLDHGKAIPAILETCKVNELWHSLPDIQPFFYWLSEAPTFKSALHELANQFVVSQAAFILRIWRIALEQEIEIKSFDASRKEEEIDGVRIHFLAPARKTTQAELNRVKKGINKLPKAPTELNNFSLVLAFEYAGKVVLLCADALKDTWKDALKALERAKIPRASVVKVPHHGARNAFHLNPKFTHELNCWHLCEERPVAVLFAGDAAHPDPGVLVQLQKRTQLLSIFSLSPMPYDSNPLGLETSGAEAIPTRPRQLQHCRIVVEIDSAGSVSYSTL
jgi:beta-lactamase superfamily II metal-dependent hydrolase